MTQTTRKLTYKGPPALAGLLVHMLNEEGVTVEWERPMEQRDAQGFVRDVLVNLTADGTLVAIALAVSKFRARVKGHADVDVEIEDQDEEDED